MPLLMAKLKHCSYSGSAMGVKGTCKLGVLDQNVKFYGVETKEDPILGLVICEKLELIEILQIHKEKPTQGIVKRPIKKALWHTPILVQGNN